MLRRLLVVFLLIAFAEPSFAQNSSLAIRIDGSPSMQPCARRLADWYRNTHPQLHFAVSASGADKAIAALIEGRTDIAQSARQVLGGEITTLREKRSLNFVQFPVAFEVAGIFVHPANPVHALSLFELRQILSGTIKNWKQVGGIDSPITIYGRDDTSDVRGFLEEEFMGDLGVPDSANKFAKNSDLYAAVALDRNAIGFAPVDLALGQKVSFIAIKSSANAPAFGPTVENIRDHKYPLVRPLYLILAGQPSGELQLFCEWALSSQGQLVVEAAEFWPLGAPDREKGKNLLAAR